MRKDPEKAVLDAAINHVQGCIDDLEITGYREDCVVLDRYYGVIDKLRAAKAKLRILL